MMLMLVTLCAISAVFGGKPSNCYMSYLRNSYTGSVNRTVNGRTCQRWDSITPHNHTFGATMPHKAHNFCRVLDEERPWCYTMNEAVRWEWCPGIPRCEYNKTTCTSDNNCFISELGCTHVGDQYSLAECRTMGPKKDAKDYFHCQNDESHTYTCRDCTGERGIAEDSCPFMCGVCKPIPPDSIDKCAKDPNCYRTKYGCYHHGPQATVEECRSIGRFKNGKDDDECGRNKRWQCKDCPHSTFRSVRTVYCPFMCGYCKPHKENDTECGSGWTRLSRLSFRCVKLGRCGGNTCAPKYGDSICGGAVARIDNAEENDAVLLKELMKRIGVNFLIIDGNDKATAGKWVGRNNVALKFLPWIKGGPRYPKGDEHCIARKRDGTWKNLSCDKWRGKSAFLCQKRED